MADIPEKLYKSIRRIQINSHHIADDLLVGAYRSYFRGRGMELKEVREFQQGDEERAIDWNVTARYQRPFVKMFHEERELTVMLLVDVSSSLQFGGKTISKRELLADAGALFAFAALKNNDKVGLILFAGKVEKYIPPKKGMRHTLRIVREMLAFEPHTTGTNLKEALTFLGKVQKRSGICFLISDFLCDQFTHELTLISKKDDLIAIKVSDPQETEIQNLNILNVKDLETGNFRTFSTHDPKIKKIFNQIAEERGKKLYSLIKRIKGGLIELSTDQDYVPPIRRFFKMRKRNIR